MLVQFKRQCFAFTWIVTTVLSFTAKKKLNDYISDFEEVHYERESLHESHLRAKRSLDPYLHLQFSARGRNFNLRLRRDTSIFSNDFKLELSNGQLVDYDTSHIYVGELWGESHTSVYGSIVNGSFAGRISTPKGNYYIERADFYFVNPAFPSILYHEEDVVDDPHRLKRSAELGACGAADQRVKRWMEDIQKSSIVGHTPAEENRLKRDTRYTEREHHNIYTPFSRHKRATVATTKTACSLFLQSDTLLWERMTNGKSADPSGLAFSEDRAREEITSLFASLVAGTKEIYLDTQFDEYSGITFVVRRVKINETSKDCKTGTTVAENPFCQRNIDVTNFLNLNSMQNHDDFCLAYVFTYRDFSGGTLGLAWVGSPSGQSGGICEKYRSYTEKTSTGASRQVWKSLNTGIVTLVNYRSPVPLKVSTLTFAHEMGHNFGSPHDTTGSECTSTGPDGNFIMFASATSGDKPNNNKFSPCSIRNMTRVIDSVMTEQFGKKMCFVAPEAAYCGNKIVEQGEDCDCGFHEDCEKDDKCCVGRQAPGVTSDGWCKRAADAQCSPTEGPCCRKNCTFVPKTPTQNTTCARDSDCRETSVCSGDDAKCPTPVPKANKTACNENTKVCYSGECIGSICHKISWEQCYLKALPDSNQYNKGDLCYVACTDPNGEGGCVSTGDQKALEMPKNQQLRMLLSGLGMDSIKMPPGEPCDDFKGYCDVFQKCRGVDAEGPLLRLKNLLFSEKTFTTIRDWIVAQWWAVLLMGIGLVVLMGLFIHVCAVHTPSSNPKKPPPRKISFKPRTHRPQGPPPPYSGPSRGGPPHGRGQRGRHEQYEMRGGKPPRV